MDITFFDLETNGLIGKPAGFMPRPQSCAYITINKYLEFKDSGVMYFYNNDLIKHSDTAEKGEAPNYFNKKGFEGHGLSREFLSQYEKDFIPNCRKLHKLIYRGNLGGHNIRDYDVKVAKSLSDVMLFGNMVPINKIYDTIEIYMPYWRAKGLFPTHKNGKVSLQKACEHFEIDSEILALMYEDYFGEEPTKLWHGAQWDTVASLALFKNAISMKLIRGV